MAGDVKKRIEVDYVLDSTGFNKNLQLINNSVKQNNASLKLAGESVKAFGGTQENLKNIQQQVAKSFEMQKDKVNLYKDEIEKTNSKMQSNVDARDKLKVSLENEKVKYSEVIKLYGKESEEATKAKASVDKLTEEYKRKEKAVENNNKTIGTYTTKMTQSKTEMVKTEAELRNLGKVLSENDNKWLNASKSMQKNSEGMKNAGSKMNSVGNGILAVTAPLVAAGVASEVFGMQFEDNLAKVSTISDDAVIPISELKKEILNLSNESGVGLNSLTGDVYEALSAGQSTGDVMGFVAKNTKLAKAGFADSGESLDLLTTIMNSYGLKATDVSRVSDVLINTQNKGKVSVGELSKSMGQIIPTANAVGVNLEQLSTGYAIMTSKGVKSAETTTYMNSLFNELGKSGTVASDGIKKMTGKTFQTLIKEGKSVGDVLAIMDKGAKANGLSLSDMFGSAEAGKAAMLLSAEGGNEFNKTLGEMNNSLGETDKALAKVTDTKGEKFRKNLNAIKNESIRLGDALAPLMEKGIELLGKLTDKLSGMSTEQIESMAKMTLFAVSLGGVLKLVGGAVTGVGNLVGAFGAISKVIGTATVATEVAGAATVGATGATVGATGALAGLSTVALPLTLAIAALGIGIYAVHESNDMLSKSCNVASEDLSGMEKAMATLSGVTLHSKEAMSELGIKYGEWNKDVSPETQTALTDITTKVGNLKLAIENGSGIENFISTADGVKVQQQAADLIEGIKKKIEEKTPGVQKNLQEIFNTDGVIDEEEKKTLEAMDIGNKNQLEKLEGHNVKIKELQARTANETAAQRKVTAAEIQTELDAIAQIGLESSVSSQAELLASQADFNARIKTLDVTGLSDILKEKSKMRDDNIAAENLKYNTSIEALKLSLNTAGEAETVAINNSITKLEKGRDDSVQKEKEKYKGFLDTATEGNAAVLTNLDLHNGEMLTNQEKSRRAEVLKYGDKMEDLLGITASGWYNIKDKTTGQMHETYVNVDEKTGMIEGVWDATTNSIIGKPITAEENINQQKIENGFNTIENNYDGVKDSIFGNGVEVAVKETWNPFGWLTSAWTNAKNWLSNSPATVNTGGGVDNNWTGTDNFQGGLTTMHEKGWELYNLPKQSKIYNHDASEAMVLATAESVATKVANSVMSSFSGGGNQNITIEVPVNLDGREIARITTPYVSNNLAMQSRRR
ncbi:phage tail tape measure protein [Clostridium gasigenes]|uniref:phage tail tape measure protein n=1 Tax=Clostridium gasigenes TaxID=94869 RepID=UPI00143841F2|nr:phage tail tape measure protein [Clostridium gasigenes]NKF05305.1 phage tail tape measure protein [Clostridium gasigenes]QSW18759.1 phage tail tape measure protein [Clostridium gasigenes]